MLLLKNLTCYLPSGCGLVIPVFLGGDLPQSPDFCSAKQILVGPFATQVWARILRGLNIFCTLVYCTLIYFAPFGRTKQTAGSNAPGAFFVIISPNTSPLRVRHHRDVRLTHPPSSTSSFLVIYFGLSAFRFLKAILYRELLPSLNNVFSLLFFF